LKPALPKPYGACGVSRFEPNSIHTARNGGANKIRSSPVYAGHAIKPLKNLRLSWAPAVSDRIEVVRLNRRPLPDSTETRVSLPFQRSIRTTRKEQTPIVSAFWNASTDVPATASTSGGGYLSAPARIAKSKNRAAANGAQIP